VLQVDQHLRTGRDADVAHEILQGAPVELDERLQLVAAQLGQRGDGGGVHA